MGCLGCLGVRHDRAARLERQWVAGGPRRHDRGAGRLRVTGIPLPDATRDRAAASRTAARLPITRRCRAPYFSLSKITQPPFPLPLQARATVQTPR